MFRVSLTLLIFIYLFLFLSVVLVLWIVDEARRLHREKAALRFRLRCALCGLDWTDPSPEKLPRCPRCGTLNERWKISRL